MANHGQCWRCGEVQTDNKEHYVRGNAFSESEMLCAACALTAVLTEEEEE